MNEGLGELRCRRHFLAVMNHSPGKFSRIESATMCHGVMSSIPADGLPARLPGTRIRIKSACKSKDNARSCPNYAPKKVPWSGLFFQGAAR